MLLQQDTNMMRAEHAGINRKAHVCTYKKRVESKFAFHPSDMFILSQCDSRKTLIHRDKRCIRSTLCGILKMKNNGVSACLYRNVVIAALDETVQRTAKVYI